MGFTNDTFTAADNTLLENHTSDSAATWTKHGTFPTGSDAITGNRLRGNSSTGTLYYTSDTPPSADQRIEAVVHRFSSISGQSAGLYARINTAAETFYNAVYYEPYGAWCIFKSLAGTYSEKGTHYNQALSAGTDYALKFEVSGGATTTLALYVDGVLRVSTTDSTSPITAAGRVGCGVKVSMTASTGMHLDNFVAADLGNLAAAYTLTGPSSGVVDVASTNFTVTPNAAYTGTITPASSGSGTFSPTSLSWSAASDAKTFTYTPTSTTGSPHTISTTSSPSLTDPSSIAYTVNPAPVTVAVDDTDWFWSPYSWYVNGSTSALAQHLGAYFILKFTGTSLKITVDQSGLSGVSSEDMPILGVTVDGGAVTRIQLSGSGAATVITIATGLAAGTHSVLVYIAACTDTYDRWTTPSYAVKILSATIDGGASVSAPTLKTKRIIAYGDSICEGFYAIGTAPIAGSDALRSYLLLLREAMDAEIGNIGWSAQAYAHAGSSNVPPLWTSGNDALTAWNKYYAGQSMLSAGTFPIALDEIWCFHGRNDAYYSESDATVKAACKGWIAAVRAAAGASTIIRVFVPFSGDKRTPITEAVSESSASAPIYLHDLGTAIEQYYNATPGGANLASIDDVHPNGYGHAMLAAMIAESISVPDLSLYVLITSVVAATWVVVGHDNYTGGSAGEYPTTATSKAAQHATDAAFLETNKAEIITTNTAIFAEFGVTGTAPGGVGYCLIAGITWPALDEVDGGVHFGPETGIEYEGTGVNASTVGQLVRDAMKLAPSAGAAAAGSVDSLLLDLPTVAEFEARTLVSASYTTGLALSPTTGWGGAALPTSFVASALPSPAPAGYGGGSSITVEDTIISVT